MANNLAIDASNQRVVSSLDLAEALNRPHFFVLNKIKYLCSRSRECAHYFSFRVAFDAQGAVCSEYEVTRDGFVLLALLSARGRPFRACAHWAWLFDDGEDLAVAYWGGLAAGRVSSEAG